MLATQTLSRTNSLFIPTTVKISEKHRLLMEERELELRMEAFRTRAKHKLAALSARLGSDDGMDSDLREWSDFTDTFVEEDAARTAMSARALFEGKTSVSQAGTRSGDVGMSVLGSAPRRLTRQGDIRSEPRPQTGLREDETRTPAGVRKSFPATVSDARGAATGTVGKHSLRSHLSLKQKHRFLGESAVPLKRIVRKDAPLTTRKVVAQTYHKSDTLTMAKRKFRAFYRQMVGAVADAIAANEVVVKVPSRLPRRAY